MHRTLIVARMDPAIAPDVAQAFAESDNTDLPVMIGVSRRTLFAFHDLLPPRRGRRGHHPQPLPGSQSPAVRPDQRPAEFISPYDPDWREPKDAMARPFYTWTPQQGVLLDLLRCRVAMSTFTGGPVEIAQVAANTRRGGDIRVTLSPRTVGCTSGFGGVLTLQPAEYVTEHYHPYSEEFSMSSPVTWR